MVEVVHHPPGATRNRFVAVSDAQHDVFGMQSLRFALATEVEVRTLHAFVAKSGDPALAAVANDARDSHWKNKKEIFIY